MEGKKQYFAASLEVLIGENEYWKLINDKSFNMGKWFNENKEMLRTKIKRRIWEEHSTLVKKILKDNLKRTDGSFLTYYTGHFI